MKIWPHKPHREQNLLFLHPSSHRSSVTLFSPKSAQQLSTACQIVIYVKKKPHTAVLGQEDTNKVTKYGGKHFLGVENAATMISNGKGN